MTAFFQTRVKPVADTRGFIDGNFARSTVSIPLCIYVYTSDYLRLTRLASIIVRRFNIYKAGIIVTLSYGATE